MATATKSRRPSKAAQDRAMRESKVDEAQTAEPVTVDEAAEDAASMNTGQWVELPAKRNGGGGNRNGSSVWADRLNEVADGQAENPGKHRVIFTTKKPKGAAVMAASVKKRIREGTLNGLVGGGTFEIVTRGCDIFARFVPAESEDAEQA